MATNTTAAAGSDMGSAAPLVLYDVAYARPYEQTTCAPNPWKARYALNFKGLAHSTRWVHLPDIEKVRSGLGVPPCRKFADGTDFYTLPVLQNTETGVLVGDSLDIAHHLQTAYPDAGAGDLFPPQDGLKYDCPGFANFYALLSERPADDPVPPAYSSFNSNVDLVFSLHARLIVRGQKWDPEWEDAVRTEFLRRGGFPTWEAMDVSGEERVATVASLREGLRGLAAVLARDTAGPFVLGQTPSFADIIIGGWLRCWSKAVPEEEWQDMRGWYDGCFGRLHDVLQERFGQVK